MGLTIVNLEKINDKLRTTYLFIADYKKYYGGLSPSRREIANILHTSTSIVDYYLKILEEIKLVYFKHGSRNIMLHGETYIPPTIDVKGRINARKSRKKKKKTAR